MHDIFYPLHKSGQMCDSTFPRNIQLPAVCPIGVIATLQATVIITGVGSTYRIRNTDVAVCLASDVQLHVLP